MKIKRLFSEHRTAGLLIVGLLCTLLLAGCGKDSADFIQEKAVVAGKAYVAALAEKDPAPISETIEAQKTERIRREAEEQMQYDVHALAEGEKSVWSYFSDYVILGDSRAVGFYYYDYLDEERVLADGGETIADVEKHLETMESLNPSLIYLCYGLNDVSIGYWDTPEEYVEALDGVIALLEEHLPQAHIVISSILPAHDPAFERAEEWREIPTFSAAVQEYCEEHGIAFADNEELCEEFYDYWDEDGIHVRREFYPYWGANLLITARRAYEN